LARDQRIVIEISENTLSDRGMFRQLCEQVKTHDMGIAFDDFGVGQCRLVEMAELRPHSIKLDIRLIRKIDTDNARRSFVEALSDGAKELGVRVIAEGIETAAEAETCRRVGCCFGQGYFFGPPRSAIAWRRSPARDQRQMTSRTRSGALRVADI
jgi:EAL domain-containing protein (putative c-di-GMP-specific phosphodiesterase class I)